MIATPHHDAQAPTVLPLVKAFEFPGHVPRWRQFELQYIPRNRGDLMDGHTGLKDAEQIATCLSDFALMTQAGRIQVGELVCSRGVGINTYCMG